MIEIAESLKLLHSKGFIYNELRPQSFLMDDRGKLVLHDFGSSLHLSLGLSDVLAFLVLFFGRTEHFELKLGSEFQSLTELLIEINDDGDRLLSGGKISINLSTFSKNNHLDFVHLFNSLKKEKESCSKSQPFFSIYSKTFSNINYRKKFLSKQSTIIENLKKPAVNDTSLCQKKSIGIELIASGKYSAPESIRSGTFSLKSDFWSLGCIVFELFNNYSLFEFDSLTTTAAQKIRKIIRVLNLKEFLIEEPRFPLVAQHFMENLLKVDPDDRWSSFDSLLNHPWLCQYQVDLSSGVPYVPQVADTKENITPAKVSYKETTRFDQFSTRKINLWDAVLNVPNDQKLKSSPQLSEERYRKLIPTFDQSDELEKNTNFIMKINKKECLNDSFYREKTIKNHNLKNEILSPEKRNRRLKKTKNKKKKKSTSFKKKVSSGLGLVKRSKIKLQAKKKRKTVPPKLPKSIIRKQSKSKKRTPSKRMKRHASVVKHESVEIYPTCLNYVTPVVSTQRKLHFTGRRTPSFNIYSGKLRKKKKVEAIPKPKKSVKLKKTTQKKGLTTIQNQIKNLRNQVKKKWRKYTDKNPICRRNKKKRTTQQNKPNNFANKNKRTSNILFQGKQHKPKRKTCEAAISSLRFDQTMLKKMNRFDKSGRKATSNETLRKSKVSRQCFNFLRRKRSTCTPFYEMTTQLSLIQSHRKMLSKN